MEFLNLEVGFRTKTGSKESKKLRREDLIPGVLYGREIKSIPIYVKLKDFENILNTSGKNIIINISLKKDSEVQTIPAIIKDIQRDFLKDTILHIDFQAISLKESMRVSVPLEFEGEPKGVKEGGVLEHLLWEIEIECLPQNVPSSLKVDISNLGINQHLYVKDIPLPENVKLLTKEEEIVVQVLPPKITEEEIKVEEAPLEPEIIKEKKEEKEEGE
jgi:large subunit ribosomal protein L25